jgi:hypothetical protein
MLGMYSTNDIHHRIYTLYLVNVLLYAFMHPFSFLCVLYWRMYNFSPLVVS